MVQDQLSRDLRIKMIKRRRSTDIPTDMRITMHLCRGNFKSLWIGQGGYDPIAELLFNDVNVDGYFLEYDTERAGGLPGPCDSFPKARPSSSRLGNI